MSDFLLEKICTYLTEGKITVDISVVSCIEKDIYYITIYDVKGGFLEKFKLRRSDVDVINFIIKTEGLQKGIR